MREADDRAVGNGEERVEPWVRAFEMKPRDEVGR
jgi:hypothetical protein